MWRSRVRPCVVTFSSSETSQADGSCYRERISTVSSVCTCVCVRVRPWRPGFLTDYGWWNKMKTWGVTVTWNHDLFPNPNGVNFSESADTDVTQFSRICFTLCFNYHSPVDQPRRQSENNRSSCARKWSMREKHGFSACSHPDCAIAQVGAQVWPSVLPVGFPIQRTCDSGLSGPTQRSTVDWRRWCREWQRSQQPTHPAGPGPVCHSLWCCDTAARAP